MKSFIYLLPLILLGCSSYEKKEDNVQKEVLTKAASYLHSAKFPALSGTVSFENRPEGVKIKADVTKLPKNSYLGFHVHENGACEGPDYKSAGDHFNPDKKKHGGPGFSKKHFGDLGNLKTNPNGEAHFEITIPNAGNHFEHLVGRSVIVHAKKDDLKSQPSGNSGKRIACGIIRAM